MLDGMDDLLPSFFTGLPLHVLVVHLVVVLLPLATVVVALAAVVPAVRRRAGPLPVVLAGAALVLTPVASGSGFDLQRELGPQVGASPAVAAHRALGEDLVWWVVGLLVVAVAAYALHRRERGSSVSRPLAAVLAVAGVLVPLGVGYQTYRVGHSGAEAVWGYVQDQ